MSRATLGFIPTDGPLPPVWPVESATPVPDGLDEFLSSMAVAIAVGGVITLLVDNGAALLGTGDTGLSGTAAGECTSGTERFTFDLRFLGSFSLRDFDCCSAPALDCQETKNK